MAITYWEGLDMGDYDSSSVSYGYTQDQLNRQDRQQAIYTAQVFFSGQQPSAEEFIDFAKRVVDYVSNGQ